MYEHALLVDSRDRSVLSTDALELSWQMTMGLLWRLVSPFVSTFNAAPTVKIHDPVLGVANRPRRRRFAA